MHRIAALALASWTVTLLAAATSHAQTVHVVQLSSPGLTKALQNAIDISADGDVILVKPGSFNYPPVSILGKSLSIVADNGGTVNCGGVVVQNLPAGGRVVVRGMKTNFLNSGAPGVLLKDNAGSIWFEDCDLRVMRFGGLPIDTVDVENCAAVTFTRCFLVPASGGQQQEGSGLGVKSSAVSLFDSVCVGGPGMFSRTVGFPPSPGGPGVRVDSGSLFASGSTLVGGTGGAATFVGMTGGQGGDAIVVAGSALLRDSTLIPGVPASPLAGTIPGSPGNPSLVLPGGSLTTSSVPARHFVAFSPVREAQTAGFAVSGIPGEHAAALVATDLAQGPPLNLFDATVVVSLGAVVDAIDFGVIPAGGSLTPTLPMPTLPPAAQCTTIYLQSFFFDLSVPSLVLGPGSALLLLDSGF